MATLPARMNKSAQLMCFPYLLLDRPQQPPRLVEVAVVRPAVERSEALLAAVGAAAPVGGAIGARRVPGHADHERAVVPVIGRPPRLAVGHQRGEVALQCLVVELERFGIIEVLAHRIGRDAALVEDVQRQGAGHQSVLAAEQRADAGRPSTGQPIDLPVFASMISFPFLNLRRRLGARTLRTETTFLRQ